MLTFYPRSISLPQVPGQYSSLSEGYADRAPDPRLHERVVAVEGAVLVMASKQRPKRVAMLGSSGKRHVFLVKGGEDLRNDERVQQLFALMNAQVCNCKICDSRNRRLCIDFLTYTAPLCANHSKFPNSYHRATAGTAAPAGERIARGWSFGPAAGCKAGYARCGL
jgi:hypothetical protein